MDIPQPHLPKKRTPGPRGPINILISWALGALFLIVGVIMVFSKVVPGLALIFIAADFLPPVTSYLEKKWNQRLTWFFRLAWFLVGFVVFGMTIE